MLTSADNGSQEAITTPLQYESKTPWKVLLLNGSLILLVVSLFNILDDMKLDRDWPLYVTIGFVLWVVIYLISTYKYFNSLYLFTSAYICSLSVFHLGHIVSHSLGWFNITYLVKGSMAPWYEQAGWYCLLALASLGIGKALSLKSYTTITEPTAIDQSAVDTNLSRAFWVGLGLFMASMAALILVTISVGNIMQFSRAEIFGGVGDTRGFGFFLVVVPSAIVLMTCTANRGIEKLFAYSMALLVLLMLLFLGYRSEALFAAFIGVILWVKLGRKMPISVMVGAIVFVLVAVPASRYLRDVGPYQDVTGKDIARSVEQSKVQEVFMEIGGTSGIVAYVLKWVPEEYPYRYGQSYLTAIVDAVPNIGSQISESEREQLRRQVFINKETLQQMSPSDWFTYHTSRYMFETGGGSGFSAIAEAYLNLGLAGVIIFFSGLGFALGKLEQVDLRMHPKLLIFSGALLWPLLKTARNSFGVFTKPFGLIIASILIWKLITFWKSRRGD